MKKLLFFFIATALFLTANAQITSVTALYGKYKFTSTMTVTEAGKAYESNFAAESEVTITSHNIYDASVFGIAGGQGGAMGINLTNFDEKKIGTNNPNSVNHWGNSLIGITSTDGKYPWGGNYIFVLYYDGDGNLTMDDFALVLGNHSEASTTILAQFTNCKMTLVEEEVIAVDDMSGNWHFKATDGGCDWTADFPGEWDMVITSTSQDFREYSVEFAFEGYGKFSLDATFDGSEMVIPFDNTYIDTDKKILILSYFQETSGNIRFKKGTTTSTMSLSSGLRVAQEAEDGSKNELQWYSAGAATKQEAEVSVDFAGVYTVSVGTKTAISEVQYPETFKMEIVYNEADDNYLVTKFFDQDITALNNGGIPANVSAADASVLEISVGDDAILRDISASESQKSYIVLYDNQGLNTGKVTFAIDAESRASLSDFTTYCKTDGNAAVIDAMFQNNTVAAGDAVVVKPIDYTKSYTLKFDADRIVVKDAQYGVVFPSEWELRFADYSQYDLPVYLTEFLGNNIYNLNYGGATPITVSDDDARTFTLKMTNNSGKPLRVVEVVPQETYLVLRDKDGGDTPVSITIDADGNAVVSDFALYAYDVASDKLKGVVAVYGGDSETGISSVAGASSAVTVSGGAVVVAGEPTYLEIYNIVGVRVYSGVANRVDGLPHGIYLVKIADNAVRVAL